MKLGTLVVQQLDEEVRAFKRIIILKNKIYTSTLVLLVFITYVFSVYHNFGLPQMSNTCIFNIVYSISKKCDLQYTALDFVLNNLAAAFLFRLASSTFNK